MPVPTTMADLSATAASNSPAGTDAIGNSLDDYLRATQAILRSLHTQGPSMPSAATVDIASNSGEYLSTTGTTTISSFGTGYAGCYREIYFNSGLTIQHSATLILPGSVNMTVQAGDVLGFRCGPIGTWLLVSGSRTNDPLKANLASPAFTGTPTSNGFEVGYRGIPQTVQNATYSFVAADAGRARIKSDASAYTYTVNAATHSSGDVITVVNSGSAGNVTIAGSGVTLQLSGTTTTGNRTIPPGGVATIFFDSASHAFVGGAGVS